MTTDTSSGERRVRPPAPVGLSAEAKEFLDNIVDGAVVWPPLDDTEGWLAIIDVMDSLTRERFAPFIPPEDVLARTLTDIAGVPTYVLTPGHVEDPDHAPLFVEVHGGGLVMAGGELTWMIFADNIAERCGVSWAPDYRNPPLHPYPAALDDCVAVYRQALQVREPDQIVVSGTSGGGNLAAAMLLRAKQEGLPMPACLTLMGPEVDLTESGDSFRTNLGIDTTPSLMQMNLLYANGHDLADPLLSPLFGDLRGFPPTFLQTGTRDLFLSNTVRMHRALLAAGVDAELHVFEAMTHGGFGYRSPEDAEVRAAQRRFEHRHLGLSNSSTAK